MSVHYLIDVNLLCTRYVGSVDVSAGVSTNDGPLLCQSLGGIGRKAAGRVHSIQSDQYRRHFAVMVSGNTYNVHVRVVLLIV